MKTYKVIGLISGTSLDGLDIAYCHVWKGPVKWEFEIKHTQSVEYSSGMRENLKNAIHLSAESFLELLMRASFTSVFITHTFMKINTL